MPLIKKDQDICLFSKSPRIKMPLLQHNTTSKLQTLPVITGKYGVGLVYYSLLYMSTFY